MKKLTRKSLDELAKIYPVLSDQEQRGYVAGASPTGSVTGVARDCDFEDCTLFHDPGEHYIPPVVITPGGSNPNGGGSSSGTGVTGSWRDESYDGGGGGDGSGGGSSYDRNVVTFNQGIDQSCVSAYSLDILSRLGNVVITSTARSPERQAQAMLNNMKSGNHVRYLDPGTAVQNVYDASLSDAQNLKNMTDKIEEVGASNVSKHCLSNFNELNVVDISKGAITTTQLDGMKNSGVISSYINEKECYHIVIPQKK